MTTLFTYNQEQAASVGTAKYDSDGYDLKIVSAKWVLSESSQAKFLEFNFESREGSKFNFVKICYVKGDGENLDFGGNLIQAVMGCAGVGSLSSDQQGNCPELLNKGIKGVLQRITYTKGDGSDGYKFDLKLPANIKTGQTIKEQAESKPAQAFAAYSASIEDKDERKPQQQGAQSWGNKPQQSAPTQQSAPQMSAPQQATPAYQQPSTDFDDDIPF